MNINLINLIQYKQGGKTDPIHIKKKNEGKFTSYCGGKVTDACIQRAKASGNSTLVKRAVFAENARKWKHKDGGVIHNPVLNKTIIVSHKEGGNINKYLLGGNMEDPDDSDFRSFAVAIHGNAATAQKAKQLYYDLKSQGLTEAQAAASVVNAGIETGGTFNPSIKSKVGYQGLFQWAPSRFPGKDYKKQINAIANQLPNKKYYTNSFNLVQNPDSTAYQVGYGITKGYTRGGNPNTRGKIAQKYFGMTNNK